MSSTSLFKWIGLGQSGKTVIDNDCLDEGERYFGLENFGNTCYCNSVLQALYYCKPFRECVTNYPRPFLQPQSTPHPLHPSSPNVGSNYFSSTTSSNSSSPSLPNARSDNAHSSAKDSPNLQRSSSRSNGVMCTSAEKDQNGVQLSPGMEDTMFAALKDLFWKIATHKKKTGVVAPVNFINKVKKENELFRSSMHQDAHEFLNYLLNTIAEDVQTYQKKKSQEHERSCEVPNGHASNHQQKNDGTDTASDGSTEESSKPPPTTWVHQLFEGVFSNETKCLTCETVTSRDESFMDLSIDVEMNSSITSCLRQFSASETLCHKNKYFCDVCCGLQEAQRRMKIKTLPNILALHLKRFKYQEQLQKYIKLTYRVVFPFELRLFNTCDDTDDADRMYELWACIIHIGSGPHHGHYVTIIKSNGQWMLFDDDVVTPIQEEDIQKYFSDLPGTGCGYVLFYQAVNLSMDSLNIWDGVEENVSRSDDTSSNGRPSTVSPLLSRKPPGPLRLDSASYDLGYNTLSTPAKEDMHAPEIFGSVPMTPPASMVTEEKKSRWGLSRKMREKKDKR